MLFVIKTDSILKFIFIYILTIVCALALQKQYEHIVLQECSILITSQCIVVFFFTCFIYVYVCFNKMYFCNSDSCVFPSSSVKKFKVSKDELTI